MRSKVVNRRKQQAASMEKVWYEACKLWDQGKLRSAFQFMDEAAKGSFAPAQAGLGYFYDLGIGTRKNASQAMYWYRRAAKQGNAYAANNIAINFRDRRRFRDAVRWFQRAGDLGDVEAYLEAAKLEINQLGNRASANVLLRKVIRSGLASAGVGREAKQLLGKLRRNNS